MRLPQQKSTGRHPQFYDESQQLARAVLQLHPSDLQACMKISKKIADKTYTQFERIVKSDTGMPAIDAFLGDIYSGLQVQSLTESDRSYADKHLRILSGLYGILRPLDFVQPYRLEMAYKLPSLRRSLYDFWGDTLAKTIPQNEIIINVSSVEYTKTILPYVNNVVITPKFLTRNDSGVPTFVTVHAKIARGAFAHWMITRRIESIEMLKNFNELGYYYDDNLSTELEPTFVCDAFGGLGLSVRLS